MTTAASVELPSDSEGFGSGGLIHVCVGRWEFRTTFCAWLWKQGEFLHMPTSIAWSCDFVPKTGLLVDGTQWTDPVRLVTFLCIGVYLHVCLCARSLGTKVRDSCEPPCGWWKLNPAPPEEQPVFLVL